jgi:cytochrome c oxidase subunit 1
MSVTTLEPGDYSGSNRVRENYINVSHTIKSWLLTVDHKRIAILYLVSVSLMFLLGGLAAGIVRFELTSAKGQIMSSENYNRMFTSHGVIMVFLFLVPVVPATLGNFLVPLMVGARDLAFPRLNLASWYIYMVGGMLILGSILFGGVDTGWTFYTPYSSIYSNSNVSVAILGIFLAGFSSIFTAINFIVTIHKMRAPGLTWFRLPLFIWAMYATSVIIVLGTPVVAITLALVMVERLLHIGIFSPELGGDPVLFQHLFWFYSHPAVYIMILPSMGVISEVIAANCKKRVFGYSFVAFSTIAIAVFGFLVWGHHMFATSQSMYSSIVFSVISFLVAIPSAIKVFNWATTMYKGSVDMSASMCYALGFVGLFTIGGLTGLYLSAIATDLHLTATYFVVAHFHYVMVGGSLSGFLAGVHFWWPKMTGRMYAEGPAKIASLIVFIGFNLTFMPQFIAGYMGMPRRYHFYAPEYQIWQQMSTMGASVLGVGFLIPVFYLTYSLFYGQKAGANPWGAIGLEWMTSSPPPTANFEKVPIVTWEAYEYSEEQAHEAELDRESMPGTPERSQV